MTSDPPDALLHLDRLKPLKDHGEEAGIFLDLDGTLCTLVDIPEDVRIPAVTRGYLESLAASYKSVVISSGRAASTLSSIVGIPQLTYVGNHGLEIIEADRRRVLLPEDLAERMKSLGEELKRSVHCEGAYLELKEYSHAIHYRRSSDPEATRLCLREELGRMDLEGVRITEGKMLVQVRPDYPLDKGKTLELLVKERGIGWILYAGDDTTDMDAFRSIGDLVREGGRRGYRIAVRYADSPPSLLEMSDFSVDGVPGMQRLLEWLCA